MSKWFNIFAYSIGFIIIKWTTNGESDCILYTGIAIIGVIYDTKAKAE